MAEKITLGFVQETLRRLRLIQKAKQKEGEPQGGVTLNYNLNDGFATGSFIFPITQEDDGENTIIKAVDFVE